MKQWISDYTQAQKVASNFLPMARFALPNAALHGNSWAALKMIWGEGSWFSQ
jgi:hypothetical protein